MKVQEIDNKFYLHNDAAHKLLDSAEQVPGSVDTASKFAVQAHDTVAFRGSASNYTKRFWLMFKKLSNYMKNDNELTNAGIAAIGTGGIAPIAIMCSPGKKREKEEDKKNSKEKKMFQALRQPVSAALAFGFQFPTTVGINKGFKYLAYKKHSKFFDDEVLLEHFPGQRHFLIPDKKYLQAQAKQIINGNAPQELIDQWGEVAEIANKFDEYKDELIDKIRKEEEEVGIVSSQSELEKEANKKSKKTEFLAEKMAGERRKKLIDEKVDALIGKHIEIKDIDLVTEEYQDLAKQRYKAEFEALEKNAKLSWYDTCLKYMGISNGKLDKLDKAQKSLAKERGLEILKKDMPDLFNNSNMKGRLKKFVENCDAKSQKFFGNKIFWISLAVNLVMTAISCIALNKLHPIFADFVDKLRGKHKDDKKADKKVEVRA